MTALSVSTPDRVAIPVSHHDLLVRPICGVLTTVGPDGQPQSSLVWVCFDGQTLTINTTEERQKTRNLRTDPRLSLLVVDPEDTSRFIQIRGEAEREPTDATAHLDALTRKYTRHPRFYGFIFPVEQASRETRVVWRIHPQRVTLDAIHR